MYMWKAECTCDTHLKGVCKQYTLSSQNKYIFIFFPLKLKKLEHKIFIWFLVFISADNRLNIQEFAMLLYLALSNKCNINSSKAV